jgi:cation diffusion facilitator family transporter
MGLKAVGYLLTQSVGLLSDALESGINLVAAFTALTALHISAQPPDEDHAYGHQKVEYLSSGAEGGLISLAAIAIAVMAIQRLLNPQPIDHLSLGLLISAAASVINLVTALILIRVGRRERSIALEADGQHLMSDVWTSVGVLIGVGAVGITGWQILDPLVALIVAGWIGFNGFNILKRSALGLIDTALPEQDVAAIRAILERNCGSKTKYHALRTRQAGSRSELFWNATAAPKPSITHCAHARRDPAASSPCTFKHLAIGAFRKGMIYWKQSNVKSARLSPPRPSSPTSSHSKTPAPGLTRTWIGAQRPIFPHRR